MPLPRRQPLIISPHSPSGLYPQAERLSQLLGAQIGSGSKLADTLVGFPLLLPPQQAHLSETARLQLLSTCLPEIRHRALALYLPSESARPLARIAFDLDGTLIPQELLPLLARLHGQQEQMSRLTEEAMQGKQPFTTSFTARTALLRGLARTELTGLAERLPLDPRTQAYLQQLSQRGLPLALISSNYLPLVQVFADRFSIPTYLGSAVRWDAQGCLETLPAEGLIDEARKRHFVTQWGAPTATCYVGDGANDLPTLAAVGHALLFGGGLAELSALPQLFSALFPDLLLPTT